MSDETVITSQSQTRIGKTYFMLISKAGRNRDMSKGTRQQPFWDQHAEFIDGLTDAGFITLGGPLEDEGGAVLVVRAASEADVRQKMQDDPWYREAILELVSIKRWTIFIDDPA